MANSTLSAGPGDVRLSPGDKARLDRWIEENNPYEAWDDYRFANDYEDDDDLYFDDIFDDDNLPIGRAVSAP